MVCTFLGHRTAPQSIIPIMESVISDLIERKGVNVFYFGNQGCFDDYALGVLRTLKSKYPHIKYFVVLAYLPTEKKHIDFSAETIFSEGQEEVHPKYAICKRNQWMIDKADFVITYVTNQYGGAFSGKKRAIKMGKRVIELSEML